MEWKWSIGEIYERTPRISKPTNEPNVEQNAFNQSFLSTLPNENMELNKREDFYNKMSEREMICQVSMNPFRTNNSYVEDMMLQDQFLKPISTKEGEKEK